MRCQGIWETLGLPYLLATGTAAALAIKHGAFQAEWKDRVSTVDQRWNRCRVDMKVEWKQGEQWARGSSLPTTGCPQTTVWEAQLPELCICHQGGPVTQAFCKVGRTTSWDILSRSCHFHYPIFLYIWEPYNTGSSHGLTLYIFSLSFHLSDKKFGFYFWLKCGNQLGVISEDLKNFLLFLLFGFFIVFFSCWFDFCQISWLYYEKTFIKAWIFWEAVLTFGAQS